ncbi:gamma carbonic anhydrase family protein [Trinickia acidisoli]|uniref:gamma carbonic anhydrase family protein n=1 Tax=Trinickia acidisoli TaxID=2767482 RepID=UPI001A8E73DE|nr:gamma carbonic anhydrase family protein [Trinickia acidisoli]
MSQETLYAFRGCCPRVVGTGHYFAPGACIIGNVTIEERVSVWFNAVIRGDRDSIRIGRETNVQDLAMLHVDTGFPLIVGEGVTIGHHAALHGCTVGDYALIGINAVVLNGARIGRCSVISANALVGEGVEVPDRAVFVGNPGRVIRQLSDDEVIALKGVGVNYAAHAGEFRVACAPVAPSDVLRDAFSDA